MHIRAWREWKDFGALPFEGDSYDQPAGVTEGIQIVERVHRELEAAAVEKPREE